VIKSLLVGALLAMASASASAMSCDNPRNAYDRTYCASLKMVQSDQDINDQYKKTMSALNPDQKKKVKAAQIQWKKIVTAPVPTMACSIWTVPTRRPRRVSSFSRLSSASAVLPVATTPSCRRSNNR